MRRVWLPEGFKGSGVWQGPGPALHPFRISNRGWLTRHIQRVESAHGAHRLPFPFPRIFLSSDLFGQNATHGPEGLAFVADVHPAQGLS